MSKKYRSLKTKLVTLCLFILIVPSLLIGFSAYSISKKQLTEAGKAELQKSAHMVIGMINLLQEDIEAGHISKEDAQEKLRQEILGTKDGKNRRTLKNQYITGESGFIWALDQDGVTVMDPSDEGKDLTEVTIKGGMNLGKEFLKHGKKSGFISYTGLHINTGKEASKLAYVKTEPNWGWTVGSSAYASEFNKHATKVAYIVAIITFFALLTGGVLSYYFAHQLTKPIRALSRELHATAAGDLSGKDIEVSKQDELGLLCADYNQMRANMRELLLNITHSTNQVAAASEQLSASSEETSLATHEITEAIQHVASNAEANNNHLEESSSALEEVTTSIQDLAENSNSISSTSKDVIEQARQGNDFVEHTVKQMNSIHQKVNESNDILQLLHSSSDQIDEISKAITAIANQTNLLALNAAIEAARAGEHGKGFAVVADEVRHLAEQSQTSSKQISELIKEIQNNMNRSTVAMDHVKQEVQDGMDSVRQTELSFKGIAGTMTNMNAQILQIDDIIQEMSANAQEVSATMSNISAQTKQSFAHTHRIAASTEEQLAAMEEIASSSTAMAHLAAELQHSVHQFTLERQ